MKGGDRFFEANDTGPPLVYIGALGDLREFLGKPRQNAASVDAANLQGNYLANALPRVFKKPVRVFLALHPTNDAPGPMSMGQRQRYRLGTVLRDPVVVMLIDLAQVCPWPREHATT
jgi:hypothetical protein